MKTEEVEEILACLDGDRRVAYYFKDRYCLGLIEYEIKRCNTSFLSVSELKKGALARFSQKPIINNVLKYCHDQVISISDLYRVWPTNQLPYSVTLAKWGTGRRYGEQTSRKQSNLVLQINFDNGHVEEYKKLIKPELETGPFESWGHPICHGKHKTLGWVRLDISLDTDEALIEEVQNDWVRLATRALKDAEYRRSRKRVGGREWVVYDSLASYEDLKHYVEVLLKPYQELWPELAMSCAIRFIRQELGINRIFYHTFDTGIKLKGIYGEPPRSMYTQLPQKFGFELTDAAPEMLIRHRFARRCIKAISKPRWFKKCF